MELVPAPAVQLTVLLCRFLLSASATLYSCSASITTGPQRATVKRNLFLTCPAEACQARTSRMRLGCILCW